MAEPGNFFKVSRKGYDVAAVDAFVAAKAQEEAERTDLISELESRIGKLNAQIDELGQEASKGSQIQHEVEQLTATNEAQQAKIAELEQQVAVVHQQEEALRLTLASATKTRDEMLAAAEEEITRSRTAAQEESERMLADANARLAGINTEVERLTTEARSEADRIKAAAEQEAAAIVARAHDAAAVDEAEHSERMAEFAEHQRAERKRLESLQHAYAELADRLQEILANGVDSLTAGATAVEQTLESHPAPPPATVPTPPQVPVATVPAVAAPTGATPAPPAPWTAPENPLDHSDPAPLPVAESVPIPFDQPQPVAPTAEPAAHEPVPVTLPVAEMPLTPEAETPGPAAPESPPEPQQADLGGPVDVEAVPAATQPVPAASDHEGDGAPAGEGVHVHTATPAEFHGGVAIEASAPTTPANEAPEAAIDEPAPEFSAPTGEPIQTDTTPAQPQMPVPQAESQPTGDVPQAVGAPETSEAEATPVPDDADTAAPEGEQENGEVDLNDEFWNPTDEDAGGRGSFYSRRSGRLPRLGADASRGAMSAALGMRISRDDDD